MVWVFSLTHLKHDNPLAQFLRERAARIDPDFVRESPLPEPPPSPLQWQVQACESPTPTPAYVSLPQAREHIRTAIEGYLAMDAPGYLLLVKAPPGTGKTALGVQAAEAAATRGRRVAYAGPRHDFFADLMALAGQPAHWYEWLARQAGDPESGKPHTCDWAEAINSHWLHKGYRGINFCAQVCGWDFVNRRCPWHAQKTRPEPIVYLQHNHLALGHPLEFSLLIGDENPMQAFLWEWIIPAEKVMPTGTLSGGSRVFRGPKSKGGLDVEDPLTELLHTLRRLCDGSKLLHGPDLLNALGGALDVHQTCKGAAFPADFITPPDLHTGYEAAQVDYAHLPQLIGLLLREAAAALMGQKYPARVWAGQGSLTLLLRHTARFKLPAHIVWLDATGDPHVYAELFGRPVQVVAPQVALAGPITVIADRANGKAQLIDKQGQPTAKVSEAQRAIEHLIAQGGYTQPGLVTYQALTALAWVTKHFGEHVANFYGARGTNRLSEVDALFVLGAPLPAKFQIQKTAAMLYFNRMLAFESAWTWRWIAYNCAVFSGDEDSGERWEGRMYPAGGYWADPDLQALVWQYREAEILQAAHRARPLLRAVPIFLLVNVPIPQLPLAAVTTSRDLFNVPPAVNLDAWLRFLAWLGERQSVTAHRVFSRLSGSHMLENEPNLILAKERTIWRGPRSASHSRNIVNAVRSRILVKCGCPAL